MFRFMLYRTTDPSPVAPGPPSALSAEESRDIWSSTPDHM
jgi:hypothetical protein